MDVLSRAALFEAAIADAAKKESVDPKILWAIAYNETRFRPWLTSPKNAQGLMQFIPATASRFGLTNAYEPNASIRAAARYVKYLGGIFNWRLDSVLAAYNAGEGTVSAYLNGRSIRSKNRVINPLLRRTNGGVPPYTETINYVSQGV
ncbi:MAG: lytic transglycosylase domain-containing protein, partial [Pyrinomonadaceae bacterium]